MYSRLLVLLSVVSIGLGQFYQNTGGRPASVLGGGSNIVLGAGPGVVGVGGSSQLDSTTGSGTSGGRFIIGSGSSSGSQGFISGGSSGSQSFVTGGSFSSGSPSSGISGSSSSSQAFVTGGSSGQILTGSGFGAGSGQSFDQLLGQVTITVTDTVTIDHFVTVTDIVYNSVPVTLTGINVNTVTITTVGVLQTEVDELLALQTTVFTSPTTRYVTTAKTNFILVTAVSIQLHTITHKAYAIHQTTRTTVATQTLTFTSPVIRTVLTTNLATFTDYRTIINTVFVRAYGYGR